MRDIEEDESVCRDVYPTRHTLIAKVCHYEQHFITCLAQESVLPLCQMLVDIHEVKEVALAYRLFCSSYVEHLVV